MEIVKRNEIFEILGSTDEYIVKGTANYDVVGNLNVDFRFSHLDETGIGNGYYNSYNNNNHSDFGISCSDEYRNVLIKYSLEVVDFIINYFKQNV